MSGQSNNLPGWLAGWRILAAAGLLVAVGATMIWSLPTKYAAESAIAVRPDVEGVLNADSLALIAHEFVVYLGSAQVTDSVEGGEGPEVSVTTTQDALTATIRITVESEDRDRAVQVANALADAGVDQGERDEDARIVVIAEATKGGATIGPPRSLYLGGLLVAAALLVIAGHYALRGRRP